jgi:hypothetical protein
MVGSLLEIVIRRDEILTRQGEIIFSLQVPKASI